MRKLTLSLAGAALAMAGAAPGHAEDAGSRQSREFVQHASASDAFEILEATSALAESKDPRVRAFAQQMIQDHTASSARLRDAASRAGITPPPPMALENDQSEFLAALQSARGHDFDQLYMRQQVLAHHAALAVEQQYAAGGDQPAIRQVAAAATPMIAGHLATAQQLMTALGGS